ncbi:unnamed protein product, partial [Staurois parvus]
MQPHRRALPQPCFTVGTIYFSSYSSPLRHHTVLKPSIPKNIYLGLITPKYRVPVVFFFFLAWALANSRQAFLCMGFRSGFLHGRHPCQPFLCSILLFVSREASTPVWLSTSLANCSELAWRFSSTLLI